MAKASGCPAGTLALVRSFPISDQRHIRFDRESAFATYRTKQRSLIEILCHTILFGSRLLPPPYDFRSKLRVILTKYFICFFAKFFNLSTNFTQRNLLVVRDVRFISHLFEGSFLRLARSLAVVRLNFLAGAKRELFTIDGI